MVNHHHYRNKKTMKPNQHRLFFLFDTGLKLLMKGFKLSTKATNVRNHNQCYDNDNDNVNP